MEKQRTNPFDLIAKFNNFLSKKGQNSVKKKYDAKSIIERARKRVPYNFKPPKLS